MNTRSHLTAEAVVDVLDGHGPPEAHAHLDLCAVCRARVDDARAVLAAAAEADVPEPSPLFWDHLSGRISAAIDEAPATQQGGRGWWHRRSLAGAVAVAAAVLVLSVLLPLRWSVLAPGGQPKPADAEATFELAAWPALPDDDGWAIVTTLSHELAGDEDESGALEPGPGAAERAVAALDADEQRELVRLLEAELARRPS